MARCKACGNEYDKTFTVTDAQGEEHVFDSLQCAIHELAPQCTHCGIRIIGHGVEEEGAIYCCANCVRAETGHSGIIDRYDEQTGSDAFYF